jgi:hypothetical protein
MKEYPSLFTFVSSSDSIKVDEEIVLNLTPTQITELKRSEAEFVLWYKNEKKRGLRYIVLSGDPRRPEKSISDITDQEALCEEYMRMVNAPTIPDPELF